MIVLMIASELPGILKIIEKAFDDIPDSGAEKKAMAKAFIASLVRGVTGVTDDDADKIVEMVYKVIDPLIDVMCRMLFPHDEKEKVK